MKLAVIYDSKSGGPCGACRFLNGRIFIRLGNAFCESQLQKLRRDDAEAGGMDRCEITRCTVALSGKDYNLFKMPIPFQDGV